jgi:Amt family ammonium transporter
MAAIAIGLAAGIICYGAVLAKRRFQYDDALDVVGVHGAGGITGAIGTGLLASVAVNAAGANGLFLGNAGLLGVQLIAIGATIIYSFTVSFALLKVIELTIGLRVADEHEEVGLDVSQHSETGYAW